MSDDDGIEIRIRSWANIVVHNPMVVRIPGIDLRRERFMRAGWIALERVRLKSF